MRPAPMQPAMTTGIALMAKVRAKIADMVDSPVGPAERLAQKYAEQPKKFPEGRTRARSAVELFGHELVEECRICLPLGRFHHLANKESCHRLFAQAILLHLLGVG